MDLFTVDDLPPDKGITKGQMAKHTRSSKMLKCNKCGNENYLLLTRQNPKGENGIFHCEKCERIPVTTTAEALVAAIISKDDVEASNGGI